MSKNNIIIISAFKSEIEFLLKRYNLKRISLIKEFSIYSDAKSSIYVAISGMGNLNMSNIIGFLAGKNIINKFSLIFNIGLAGSKNDKIGSIYRANKLSMLNQKNNFYPLNIVSSAIKNKNLITTDYIIDYPEAELIDMEGYGFFAAASKFVLNEQITLLKIVSDNDMSQLNLVRQELAKNLTSLNENIVFSIIDEVKDFFANHFKEISDAKEYDILITEIKFSFSQKVILKKILNKIGHNNIVLNLELLLKLNSGKKILAKLEEYV